MDEVRRIRFLVSPALFIASLFIGAWLDPKLHNDIVETLRQKELSKLLVEFAAGGSVVFFAGGYVFGTISHSVLRLIFLVKGWFWGGSRFHEVALDEGSFRRVLERLHAPEQEPDPSQELYAGAAFDFDILQKHHEGVHEWLFRRWNGFNIAVNSISAMLLSLAAAPFVGIPLVRPWYLSVAVFVAILGFVASCAWRDTMRMVRFMANLEPNKSEKDAWPEKARKKEFVITLRR